MQQGKESGESHLLLVAPLKDTFWFLFDRTRNGGMRTNLNRDIGFILYTAGLHPYMGILLRTA